MSVTILVMVPSQADSKRGEARHEPARRPYAAPRLERFGTIRELTLGPGPKYNFDGVHPPGNNRSRI